MYELTKTIMDLLLTDTELRLRVAIGMKVTEVAVTRSVQRGGNSIANNIGAVKAIMKATGLKEEEIIEPVKTTA